MTVPLNAIALKSDRIDFAYTRSANRDRLQVGLLVAFASALSHRLVILVFAITATARFLATMMNGIHRRPSAAFSFILRDATFLVAFLDVSGLSFLFVR